MVTAVMSKQRMSKTSKYLKLNLSISFSIFVKYALKKTMLQDLKTAKYIYKMNQHIFACLLCYCDAKQIKFRVNKAMQAYICCINFGISEHKVSLICS